MKKIEMDLEVVGQGNKHAKNVQNVNDNFELIEETLKTLSSQLEEIHAKLTRQPISEPTKVLLIDQPDQAETEEPVVSKDVSQVSKRGRKGK